MRNFIATFISVCMLAFSLSASGNWVKKELNNGAPFLSNSAFAGTAKNSIQLPWILIKCPSKNKIIFVINFLGTKFPIDSIDKRYTISARKQVAFVFDHDVPLNYHLGLFHPSLGFNGSNISGSVNRKIYDKFATSSSLRIGIRHHISYVIADFDISNFNTQISTINNCQRPEE